MKQWHKVTLTFDGPLANERDTQPNPFTDIRLNITFTHESGAPIYKVPGYFAADANASESGAESVDEMARAFVARQAGALDMGSPNGARKEPRRGACG